MPQFLLQHLYIHRQSCKFDHQKDFWKWLLDDRPRYINGQSSANLIWVFSLDDVVTYKVRQIFCGTFETILQTRVPTKQRPLVRRTLARIQSPWKMNMKYSKRTKHERNAVIHFLIFQVLPIHLACLWRSASHRMHTQALLNKRSCSGPPPGLCPTNTRWETSRSMLKLEYLPCTSNIFLNYFQTALKFGLHACKICDVCGYGYILQILLIPLLLTSNQQNIKHIRLRFQQVVNSNLVVNRLADDKSSQEGTLLQLDTLQHLGPVAIGVAIRQGFRAPQFQDSCKRVTSGNAKKFKKIDQTYNDIIK